MLFAQSHQVSLPGTGKIAVIGSGVSGLTAAYLLQRRYQVTLFERDVRLGGHAHTHDVSDRGGRSLAVDSGFIVHNERTYPNLLRLFRELGVNTQDSEMSMSISCAGCGLEYAGGRGLLGVFAQPRRTLQPRYLWMLTEIVRFYRRARKLLNDRCTDATLESFVRDSGFSPYFIQHFLIPVISAVWSSGPVVSLRYPARYLFEFLNNHGLLSVGGSPTWKTVVGGSRSYVDRAVKELSCVATSTPVRVVRRYPDGVDVHDEAGQAYQFDHVVMATHPHVALRLLADPTRTEREVLGAFTYSRNETWLHTDASVLPVARGARASWNYLKTTCTGSDSPVLVSYHMNRLMRLNTEPDYLVTLNGTDRVDERSVIEKMIYEHPVYTPETVFAQSRLPQLVGNRTAYAGAYHGWGFHEDGCVSGVRAAETLGVRW